LEKKKKKLSALVVQSKQPCRGKREHGWIVNQQPKHASALTNTSGIQQRTNNSCLSATNEHITRVAVLRRETEMDQGMSKKATQKPT